MIVCATQILFSNIFNPIFSKLVLILVLLLAITNHLPNKYNLSTLIPVLSTHCKPLLVITPWQKLWFTLQITSHKTYWPNSAPYHFPDLFFEPLLSPDFLSSSWRPHAKQNTQDNFTFILTLIPAFPLHCARLQVKWKSLTRDRIQDAPFPAVKEATYGSTSNKHMLVEEEFSFLIWRKLAECIFQMFIIWPNFNRFWRGQQKKPKTKPTHPWHYFKSLLEKRGLLVKEIMDRWITLFEIKIKCKNQKS